MPELIGLRQRPLTPATPGRTLSRAMARSVIPPRSSIARPGRRYISGIIYLAIVLALAFGILGARWLLG
jgi:hypothetical protein